MQGICVILVHETNVIIHHFLKETTTNQSVDMERCNGLFNHLVSPFHDQRHTLSSTAMAPMQSSRNTDSKDEKR